MNKRDLVLTYVDKLDCYVYWNLKHFQWRYSFPEGELSIGEVVALLADIAQHARQRLKELQIDIADIVKQGKAPDIPTIIRQKDAFKKECFSLRELVHDADRFARCALEVGAGTKLLDRWEKVANEQYQHASGQTMCGYCNKLFHEHPKAGPIGMDDEKFLRRICSGALVKL